jgi:hypothetical protein
MLAWRLTLGIIGVQKCCVSALKEKDFAQARKVIEDRFAAASQKSLGGCRSA